MPIRLPADHDKGWQNRLARHSSPFGINLQAWRRRSADLYRRRHRQDRRRLAGDALGRSHALELATTTARKTRLHHNCDLRDWSHSSEWWQKEIFWVPGILNLEDPPDVKFPSYRDSS